MQDHFHIDFMLNSSDSSDIGHTALRHLPICNVVSSLCAAVGRQAGVIPGFNKLALMEELLNGFQTK
jgi:hypothetical protein